MLKTRTLFLASAALLLATAASAQQQQQSGNILEQLLGGIFGGNNQQAEQELDSNWSQGQHPFEQRRERLEARIDAAVRDGSLSRNEADYMRREYDDIVRLESQYGANGQYSQQQRTDLRTRYRALMQRISSQTNGQNNGQYSGQNGYQNGGQWQSISQQNNMFEQRLAEGVRNRSISQAEANRLRNDWRNLAQIEAQYQRGGIDAREQADLWNRYNAIDSRMGGMLAGGFGNDGNMQRWRQMETRLIAAQRAGRINATQVAQMRATMGDLERLDAAYSRTGYSAEQRSYLTRRYGELDAAMGYNRR